MARKRKKAPEPPQVVVKAATKKPQGTEEFEFDLVGPLFEQMFTLLETVVAMPLDEGEVAHVPERPGVYVLHHQGSPVYVGKAVANARSQLTKQTRTLTGGKTVAIDQISFRCITFARTWVPLGFDRFLRRRYKLSKIDQHMNIWPVRDNSGDGV